MHEEASFTLIWICWVPICSLFWLFSSSPFLDATLAGFPTVEEWILAQLFFPGNKSIALHLIMPRIWDARSEPKEKIRQIQFEYFQFTFPRQRMKGKKTNNLKSSPSWLGEAVNFQLSSPFRRVVTLWWSCRRDFWTILLFSLASQPNYVPRRRRFRKSVQFHKVCASVRSFTFGLIEFVSVHSKLNGSFDKLCWTIFTHRSQPWLESILGHLLSSSHSGPLPVNK